MNPFSGIGSVQTRLTCPQAIYAVMMLLHTNTGKPVKVRDIYQAMRMLPNPSGHGKNWRVSYITYCLCVHQRPADKKGKWVRVGLGEYLPLT